MSNALVSIIVPCYKQAQYLDECLQSVLEQTYENWECIIVNDGSPDNTEVVVEEWIQKDSRFKYLYKENGGPSSARNMGIEFANGEFILPLDADDKIECKYISLAIEAFLLDASLKVVYCKSEKFGEANGLWDLPSYSLPGLSKGNLIFCSAIYKKKDWKEVGGYDVMMIDGLEDWEFWISILKNGGNVKCLDIIGFYYRIKNSSRNNQFDENKKKQLLEYISIKHFEFFVKYLGSPILLSSKLDLIQWDYKRKLKSKKFVFDLFCKTFLGFTIFKNNIKR